MKKLRMKRKFVFLALVSLFIGYIGLRYYIKPDWFDSEYTYHKVYQYKVSKIKPQKRLSKILTSKLSTIKMSKGLQMENGKRPYEQILIDIVMTQYYM